MVDIESDFGEISDILSFLSGGDDGCWGNDCNCGGSDCFDFALLGQDCLIFILDTFRYVSKIRSDP